MEATKGLFKRNAKGDKNDCFLFESWFASKRSAEDVINVGADMIGMVKNNKKGFCKDTINNMTKYRPGGSYLIPKMKSTVPGERPLIDIGYKYNAQKVLYFINAEDSGITKYGITIYLGTLTHLMMLKLSLLLVLLSCISSLDLLTRLTTTTNPASMI